MQSNHPVLVPSGNEPLTICQLLHLLIANPIKVSEENKPRKAT